MIGMLAISFFHNSEARAAECAAGMQKYEGQCLSDKMVGYLKCLDHSGNARVRITKRDDRTNKRGYEIEVGGGTDDSANGKLIGQAHVSANLHSKLVAPDENTAIQRIDETLSPDASSNCLLAADIPPKIPGRHQLRRKVAETPRKAEAEPLPPMLPPQPIFEPAPLALSAAEAEFRKRNPAAKKERLEQRALQVASEAARVANVNENKSDWTVSRRIFASRLDRLAVPAVMKYPDDMGWAAVIVQVGMTATNGNVPSYRTLFAIGLAESGEALVGICYGGNNWHELYRGTDLTDIASGRVAPTARLELDRLTPIYIQNVVDRPESPLTSAPPPGSQISPIH